MTRRLLVIHPSRLEGENRGVYEQHVASMRSLFGDSGGWQVHALELAHPAFPQAVLAAELVIVHMLAASEVEAVIRLRRQRGLATIFEISDNFLGLGNWLPARHALRNPIVRQRILYHAWLADAVQVYSPGLEELFGHVFPRVIRLDPFVEFRRTHARRDGFVIGWGGTTSHEEDLATISPVIAGFCRAHPDVTFAFMGNLAMSERLFASIPSAQLDRREFADHSTYLDFVSGWHVGLAPMRATAFNAGRSDTKAATYAACGVAPVLQECDAYREHGGHALLFRDAEELREALEWLHADVTRAAELASRAQAWAERERAPARLLDRRTRVFDSFVARETGEPVVLDDSAVAMPVEIDALRALVAGRPDHAQARLALADALRTAGDEEQALDVLDHGPFPDVLAGLAAERRYELARRLKKEDARRHAAEIDSPVAQLRIAHARSEASVFLRKLLELQPFESIALAARLRELLAARVDDEEVRELCLKACFVAPELVPRELRPPSLSRFLSS